jgi:serine O-acetyltransferase
LFKKLRNDIKVVLERDPAARNWLEVMLCYPGFKAIRSHRVAHFFYRHNLKLLARLVSHWSRFWTGVEIHPGAQLSEGVFIDHGMGVVIGETAQVGRNVTIYQGVVLGGTGKETGKRHPTIEENVMISAGASVLGPFKVGKGSKIGAGAVVLEEVPPFSTVVGVPGRVVRRGGDCEGLRQRDPVCLEDPNRKPPCMIGDCIHPEGAACGHCKGARLEEQDMDQVHLPDPIMSHLSELEYRISELEKRQKNDEESA